MKRKHYNILSLIILIVALVFMIGFQDPYTAGLSWNLFIGIILSIIALIIMYAANKCPYCDGSMPADVLKPTKYCPYCGSDISDL